MTDASAVIAVFNRLFSGSHHTCLVGGADEPLYEPAGPDTPARIWFKDDFVASALHELAHWCIAGSGRRRQVDYGYWYLPDRSGEVQSRFEAAEAVPQGLEWILSVAAGVKFRISMDNLDEPSQSSREFRQRVQRAAQVHLRRGLPPRAAALARALSDLDAGRTDYDELRHYEELPNL